MVRAQQDNLNLRTGTTVVLDDSGSTGTIAALPDDRSVVIRVDEQFDAAHQARHVRVPAETLYRLRDGRLRLALNVSRDADSRQRESDERPRRGSTSTVVPVAEERLRVDRRRVETGRVVVDKTVKDQQRTIDEPVFTEQAEVRTVPIHRMIDHPEDVREEGDELVIPLMEEVLVVEKRLMLREELRIRRTRTERREAQTYTLRREDAHVRRIDEHSTQRGKT